MTEANWLIEEIGVTQFDVLSEDRASGKMVIRGEFGRVDKPTQNGRRYSRSLMQREFERLQPQIEARGCYGELDHPSDGKTKFARVSHLITKLKIEDDGRIIGEAELLDTPAGRIMKTIAKARGSMGVSSRGFGSTTSRQDGTQDVEEDFRLKTFDAVVDPACATARPGVYTEALEESAPEGWEDKFRAQYPDLVRKIEEDEKAHESRRFGMKPARAEGQKRAVRGAGSNAKLSEQFERRLAKALVTMRRDVEAEVRESLTSNPREASAASLMERVAELAVAYQREGRDNATTDALRAKDRQIAKLESQRERWADLAHRAGMRLVMEQELSGFAAAKTVRSVLGDLTQFSSLTQLREAIGRAKADLAPALPGKNDPKTQNEAVAVAAERGRRLQVEDELEAARARIEEQEREHGVTLAKLQRAVEIGTQLDAKLHEAEVNVAAAERKVLIAESRANKEAVRAEKLEAVAPFANRVQLMGLLENVSDKRAISEIVEQNGSVALRDSRLENIRRQVGRSTVHDGIGSVLEEDATRKERKNAGSFEDGINPNWVRSLAGV